MSDTDTVRRWCRKLESDLQSRLGATGRGLHEKIGSVEHLLDRNLVSRLRRIATIRNKFFHEDGYEIQNIERFAEDCARVHEALQEVRPRQSAVPQSAVPEDRSYAKADAWGSLARPSSKPLSLFLTLAIFSAPWFFAWWTLRRGYRARVRLFAFGWLALSLLSPDLLRLALHQVAQPSRSNPNDNPTSVTANSTEPMIAKERQRIKKPREAAVNERVGSKTP